MSACSGKMEVHVARNLVVCLDGTLNEPERGTTNVVRIYDISVKDGQQLAYYDPGVGTMGARGAVTRTGQQLTRMAGLAVGYGVKENVQEAYRFLMDNYQADDKIFIFGFSRGAYTARVLAGLLRTVSLLRPGLHNLIPYALKLYTTTGQKGHTEEEERKYWAPRAEFAREFGNPEFPNRFDKQVHFLGIWDTVKSVGWLNLKAQYQQAHWPFTRQHPNVIYARHALAIDEWRRPYGEYRFQPGELTKENFRELWFVGVHSDVGGQFEEHRLSDIALKWMADEAKSAGLLVDAKRYRDRVGVPVGQPLPESHALGQIHANSFGWVFLGAGWHRRTIRPGDDIHPSVRYRIQATANTAKPYRPRLPEP